MAASSIFTVSGKDGRRCHANLQPFDQLGGGPITADPTPTPITIPKTGVVMFETSDSSVSVRVSNAATDLATADHPQIGARQWYELPVSRGQTISFFHASSATVRAFMAADVGDVTEI